jgi:hypothetical protein
MGEAGLEWFSILAIAGIRYCWHGGSIRRHEPVRSSFDLMRVAASISNQETYSTVIIVNSTLLTITLIQDKDFHGISPFIPAYNLPIRLENH